MRKREGSGKVDVPRSAGEGHSDIINATPVDGEVWSAQERGLI